MGRGGCSTVPCCRIAVMLRGLKPPTDSASCGTVAAASLRGEHRVRNLNVPFSSLHLHAWARCSYPTSHWVPPCLLFYHLLAPCWPSLTTLLSSPTCQYEQAADAELAWVAETKRKLMALGPIRLEQDQTTAQLQVQKVRAQSLPGARGGQ